MKRRAMKLWSAEDGASAVEYAIILGLIALVLVGVLQLLGTAVNTLFEQLSNKL